MCEETTCEQGRKEIIEELESYGNLQHFWYANRDGDKYFIECPECHQTNLNAIRLFGCTSCHTRFTVYPEDGISMTCLYTEMHSVRRCGKEPITVVSLNKKDAYFRQILYGRNSGKKEEIIEKCPGSEIKEFKPDLQKNGKDAHGHEPYKRYILIPID